MNQTSNPIVVPLMEDDATPNNSDVSQAESGKVKLSALGQSSSTAATTTITATTTTTTNPIAITVATNANDGISARSIPKSPSSDSFANKRLREYNHSISNSPHRSIRNSKSRSDSTTNNNNIINSIVRNSEYNDKKFVDIPIAKLYRDDILDDEAELGEIDFKWTIIDDLRLKNFQKLYLKTREKAYYDKRRDREYLTYSSRQVEHQADKYNEVNDSRKSGDGSREASTDDIGSPDRSVVDYVIFCTNMKGHSGGLIRKTYNATVKELKRVLTYAEKDPSFKFAWIDIDKLEPLDCLSEYFGIHPLIQREFYESDTESSVTSTDNGQTLISILYLSFSTSHAKPVLKKQFICIGESFVISYLTEVLKVGEFIEKDVIKSKGVVKDAAMARRMSSNRVTNTNISVSNLKGIEDIDSLFGEDEESLAKLSSPSAMLAERLSAAFQYSIDVGPFYIMYELFREVWHLNNGSLECISRSMRYFKTQVAVSLKPREKINLVRKIQTVEILLKMVTKFTDHNRIVLMKFPAIDADGQILNFAYGKSLSYNSLDVDNDNDDENEDESIDDSTEVNAADTPNRQFGSTPNGSVGGEGGGDGGKFALTNDNGSSNESAVASGSRYSSDYLVYLNDLIELFDYSYFYCTLIKNQHGEIFSSIQSIDNAKIQNQNMNLSFVATIFWPLGFFASFFGQNFVLNGGMNLVILDLKYGTLVLYAIFALSFCGCMYAFTNVGWVEPLRVYFAEWYLGAFYGEKQKFYFKSNWERRGVRETIKLAIDSESTLKNDLKEARITEQERESTAKIIRENMQKSIRNRNDERLPEILQQRRENNKNNNNSNINNDDNEDNRSLGGRQRRQARTMFRRYNRMNASNSASSYTDSNNPSLQRSSITSFGISSNISGADIDEYIDD